MFANNSAASRPSGHLAFDASVEHRDDAADHFQMADLFDRDVEQKVFASGIQLGQTLGKVSHCSGQFAVGSAELFEDEIRELWIGSADPYGIHETLVVHEHGSGVP